MYTCPQKERFVVALSLLIFLRDGVCYIVLRKVLCCIAQPIRVVLVDLGYDALYN